MNSNLAKTIRAILYATPVVLLFVSGNMFFPYIATKGLLFRLLVEIALALYLFLIFKDRSFLPKKSALLIALSAFTGIVLIADIFSAHFSFAFWSNFERMEGFILILHLFIYFVLLGSVFRTQKEWHLFFYSSIATSIAMNLFGWLQYTGGSILSQGGTRIDSLMGNSAYFAGYVMFQAFVLLWLWKTDSESRLKHIAGSFLIGSFFFALAYVSQNERSWQGNTIMAASIIVSLATFFLAKQRSERLRQTLTISLFSVILISHICLLFFTQTRGAALGFLGGILIASGIILFSEKKKVPRIIAGVVLASTVVLVGGFIALKNADFIRSNPTLNRFAEISWSNTKGQARQIIWPMAIEGAKDKPLLGWGQEGFNYAFAKHYNPKLWSQEPWFDRTHNVFLDWLIAAGLLGLLAYISLYVFGLGAARKNMFESDRTGYAIFVGLLCAYAFQNLFIFDNLGSYILFFSLLAFLHFVSVGEKTSHAKVQKTSEVSPMLVGFIILGAFLFVSHMFVTRPFMQNRALIKGMQPQPNIADNLAFYKKAFSLGGAGIAEAREHFANTVVQIVKVPSFPVEAKQDFFGVMIDEAKAQASTYPDLVKPLVSIASAFNQINAPDLALEILLPLERITPQKQHILMQIGIAYINKGDKQAAYNALQKAYEVSPEYDEAAMLFATAALNLGDTKTAFEILETFAAKGVPLKSYVITSLKEKGMTERARSLLNKAYEVEQSNTTKALLEGLK